MATTRLPFTDSQWEELEHQALIFKYIVAGVPVPPELLFPIRRTFSSSHLSSKFFSRAAPPHFAWNVYDMGFGRKIDPEPGRCRRTDGKKWRCSKEAYPDSKYCERHMHRGKNRSRKPVEFSITSSSSSSPSPSYSSSSSSSSSSSNSSSVSAPSSTFPFNNLNLSSLCLNPPPRSRPLINAPPLFLESSGSLCSFPADNDPFRGGRRSGYKNDFFSIEPSGSIRSLSGSTMEDNSWAFTPLTVLNTESSFSHKQRDHSSSNYYVGGGGGGGTTDEKTNGHCFILGTEVATHETASTLGKNTKQRKDHRDGNEDEAEEEQRNKRVHRFLEEWPSSNTSSVSTSLFI